jgi:sialate O-acetylesterase
VLVGDVWLCIGQSNMEWPMQKEQHYPSLQGRPFGGLRFLDPVYAGQEIFGQAFPDSVMARLNSRDFYQGQWAICDSSSIKGMSAVGYYFGKAIVDETGIPIGLINLAIGGAPIESFISRETLNADERFNKNCRATGWETHFYRNGYASEGK